MPHGYTEAPAAPIENNTRFPQQNQYRPALCPALRITGWSPFLRSSSFLGISGWACFCRTEANPFRIDCVKMAFRIFSAFLVVNLFGSSIAASGPGASLRLRTEGFVAD